MTAQNRKIPFYISNNQPIYRRNVSCRESLCRSLLLQAVRHVSGQVLWANLHLLFWLSLTPFVTAWMGENGFAPVPVALYGVVLFCSAIAYYILSRLLIAQHGRNSEIALALGRDFKGKVSLAIYASAIPLALVEAWIACGLYVLVAVMWLIPDRRIEIVLAERDE